MRRSQHFFINIFFYLHNIDVEYLLILLMIILENLFNYFFKVSPSNYVLYPQDSMLFNNTK